MCLLNHRKTICRTAFVVNVKNVENLENLAFGFAFSRLGHTQYDTQPTDFSGQQVDNEAVVAVFHSSEYYAACLFQHNKHKSTKIQQITKDFDEKIWIIAEKDVPLHPENSKRPLVRADKDYFPYVRKCIRN